MTDITTRLRSIYVAEGANYVTEAADLIDNLRAKQARADQYHAAELADITAERDALVNDVHSCHAGCTLAGCVAAGLRADLAAAMDQCVLEETDNEVLRERVTHLEQLVTDATYTLSKARIWNGMGWNYNPLHPMYYAPLRDRLAVEADAIYAAREPK